MKILVTGAAGFIGSNVVDALLARGDEVIGIDCFNDFYPVTRKEKNIATFLANPKFTLYRESVCNKDKMFDIISSHRPAAIAHLAAYANVRYSIGRTPLYIENNVIGSVNLLEAAKEFNVGNFVFASTSSAYGHSKILPFIETDACNEPLSAYPASKKMVELVGYTYHNLHQMNFTTVRFFSVYGPKGRPDMMPYMTTKNIFEGNEITLYDAGQMKRDWTYVADISAGVVAAIDKPLGYEIINLGRGEPVLMADFVSILENLIGKKAILKTPPAPVSEPKITFANIDKAKALLDYNPKTSIEEGLTKFWQWYQQEA
ncbi:MAG: NAD-dependent epimerase/dehydratase family protein [Deltaproteobacteria bacterium]|nr:NAD-dependent epimerase/dehydratase family protein [Deltaproteobacteria bacterium]